MLRSLEQRTTILGIQRPFRAKPRFGTWRWGRFLSPFVLGPGGDSESPLQKPPGFFFPGLSALFYVCGPRLRRLPYPSRGEGRGPFEGSGPFHVSWETERCSPSPDNNKVGHLPGDFKRRRAGTPLSFTHSRPFFLLRYLSYLLGSGSYPHSSINPRPLLPFRRSSPIPPEFRPAGVGGRPRMPLTLGPG